VAIEYREKRIGECTYRVTQFGAKQGRGLLTRIVKLLGPSLGALLSSLAQGKHQEVEAALAAGIGQGFYELAERLTEAEVGSVLDDFAKQTVLVLGDREPRLSDMFDQHFAGRYDEMLGWAAFCLEVNFGSFFAGSSSGAGLLARIRTVLSASPSPSTSTGTSTASHAVNATAPPS
jgi:hypothetical protein